MGEVWRAWLALALSLGLPPHHFWRLSVREWRALIAAVSPDRLDRAGFAALAASFPDESHG